MTRDNISNSFLISDLLREGTMSTTLSMEKMTINTLLFQLGLVTIKSEVEGEGWEVVFRLGCPNLCAKKMLFTLKPTNDVDSSIITNYKRGISDIEWRNFIDRQAEIYKDTWLDIKELGGKGTGIEKAKGYSIEEYVNKFVLRYQAGEDKDI